MGMIREPIGKRLRVGLAVASLALLALLYGGLSARQQRINPNDATMPGWSQLSDGFAKTIQPHERTGEIWLVEDAKATFGRLLGGMLLGVALAVVIGFLMGCWMPAEAFFQTPLSILAKLNPIAMLAVFFVMVGTGREMYLAMIAFGITPVLAQTIHLAAKNDVPEQLIHKAYTLGASHMEVAVHVVGHQVLPRLIDGIRLLIGPALVYLIAAEMIVGDVGFGYRIRIQSRLLQMDVVYPYIALLALFGFAADHLLKLLVHRTCPWFGGQR